MLGTDKSSMDKSTSITWNHTSTGVRFSMFCSSPGRNKLLVQLCCILMVCSLFWLLKAELMLLLHISPSHFAIYIKCNIRTIDIYPTTPLDGLFICHLYKSSQWAFKCTFDT